MLRRLIKWFRDGMPGRAWETIGQVEIVVDERCGFLTILSAYRQIDLNSGELRWRDFDRSLFWNVSPERLEGPEYSWARKIGDFKAWGREASPWSYSLYQELVKEMV